MFSGRVLMTGKAYPQETGHTDFEYCTRSNHGYFVIVHCSEDCTILISPGSRFYVSYSDEEKILMSTESEFTGHENVQYAGFRWKENYGLFDHVYPILNGVDFNDAVVFSYVASKQRCMQNKHETTLGDVDVL